MDQEQVDKELIALLPPEEGAGKRQAPKALVRFADGRIAVEELGGREAKILRPTSRFRRSNPIFDPMTREIIGYEMEQVFLPATA